MSSSNCLPSLQTFLHHSTQQPATASQTGPKKKMRPGNIDKTETILWPLWIIMVRGLRLRQTLAQYLKLSSLCKKESHQSAVSGQKGLWLAIWRWGTLAMWQCVASGQLSWPGGLITLPVSTITGLMTQDPSLRLRPSYSHSNDPNYLLRFVLNFFLKQSRHARREDAWQEFTLVFHLRYP